MATQVKTKTTVAVSAELVLALRPLAGGRVVRQWENGSRRFSELLRQGRVVADTTPDRRTIAAGVKAGLVELYEGGANMVGKLYRLSPRGRAQVAKLAAL